MENRQSTIGNVSSLRELEALARTLLSVLLTFLNPRIARDQSGLLQGGSQIAVVFDQCARDAVTNRTRLPGRPAARNINQHVKFVCSLSHLQRLANDHPQRLIRKIRFESFPVYL